MVKPDLVTPHDQTSWGAAEKELLANSCSIIKKKRVAKVLLSFCKPKSREFERAFINEKRGNILSVVAGALLLERAKICKSCYELQDY